jgi:hypothetical protein
VATDTLGKFAFESLEAGDYQLWIAANGYVAQEYSQSSNPQDDKQLTLANGQTLGNLTIQLTPTGSIAGRVLSASGGPAVGVRVSLYEKSYGLFGEPMLGDASGAARTNDRGEYRIFWITPGRYYVGAGESDTAYIPPHFNEVTNPFALMFYPNEKVFEAASPIEVRPGAVLEAMDFILQPQTFHRIRGRIIDTRTGRPPENAILSVSGWLPSGDRSYNKAYYNAANGTFEAPNVQPGEYVLTAHPRDLTAPTAQTPFSGTAAVSVVDADVDNVMLSITPPDSIAGQIRADAPLPVRLQVQLKSTGVFASSTDTISAVADDDGSFTLQAQRNAPMEYRVVIEELPPGWYLKEARLGDRDARTPTRLSGNGKLEILLSSRAGNVIGVIESAQGRPAPTDVTAVLVPDARQRLDLFQVVGFEPDGRFAFSNVAPGAYKIFAWEDIESSAWFDPALLKEFEDKATPVRVSESSRETVNVRAIPAGDGR